MSRLRHIRRLQRMWSLGKIKEGGTEFEPSPSLRIPHTELALLSCLCLHNINPFLESLLQRILHHSYPPLQFAYDIVTMASPLRETRRVALKPRLEKLQLVFKVSNFIAKHFDHFVDFGPRSVVVESALVDEHCYLLDASLWLLETLRYGRHCFRKIGHCWARRKETM